jgi:hypothetical protein
LKLHWKDVLKHVKKDLAYIWSKPIKKDIEKMTDDLERIGFVLRRLSAKYKRINPKFFESQILDIDTLLSTLSKKKLSNGWVITTAKCLNKVLEDFEADGVTIRKYKGDLHVHSKDMGYLPFSGSNPGAIAVADLVRYAATRMGNEFTATTDYSSDANPEKVWSTGGQKGILK